MNLNNDEKRAILTVLADAICLNMKNEALQSAYEKVYAEWSEEMKQMKGQTKGKESTKDVL